MDFPRAAVPVRCGGLRGTMLWDGVTVRFKKEGDEALLTGKEFETLAGKGSAKKWKHSVQLLDGSMNAGAWLKHAHAQQASTSHSLLHTHGNCNEVYGQPRSSCGSQQVKSEDEGGDAGKDESGGLEALQKDIVAKKVERTWLLQEGRVTEAKNVKGKLERLLRLEKALTPFKWDKNGPPANLDLLLPRGRCKRSKQRQQCLAPSRPSSSPSPQRQQLFPHSSLSPRPPNITNAASLAPCARAPSPTEAWPSQQALLIQSDEPVQDRQQHTAVPLSHAQEQHLPVAPAPPHFRFISSGEAKLAQVQLLQHAARLTTTSSTGAEWSVEEDATDGSESPPTPTFQTAPSAPFSQRNCLQGDGEHVQPVGKGLGPEQVDLLAEGCMYAAQAQQLEAKLPQQVHEQAKQQAAVPVGTAAVPAHHSGPSMKGNNRGLHPTAAEASTPSAEAATPLPGFSIPSHEAINPSLGFSTPSHEAFTSSPEASTPPPQASTPPAGASVPSAAAADSSPPSPATSPGPPVVPPPQLAPSMPAVATLQRVQEDRTVAPSTPAVAISQRMQAESTVLAGSAQQDAGAEQGADGKREGERKSAAGERKSGGLLDKLILSWKSLGPRQQQQQSQQQYSSQQNVTKRERGAEGGVDYSTERSVRARVLEYEDVANADKEQAADGAVGLIRSAGPSGPKGGVHSNAQASGVDAAGPVAVLRSVAHAGGVGAGGPEAVLDNNDAGGVVAAGPEAQLHSNARADGVVTAGPGGSASVGQAGPEYTRLLRLVSRLAALLGQPQPGGKLALRLSRALETYAVRFATAGQEECRRWEPEACRVASYKRLEGMIRSSFYMARARQQQQQQPGPACGLVQLLSSTIDIDRWCSEGLPPHRPLPASQGTVAIVRTAASAMEQLMQGCGSAPAGPHSLPDFDSLLRTCSQVVQAIGEEAALRSDASTSTLLYGLLLQVYGSREAHLGTNTEERTVQALTASVEPAHGIFRAMQELESSN